MRILWLGADRWGSQQRADACRRLGHQVSLVDPRRLLPAGAWVDRWTWTLGGALFEARVRRGLLRQLAGRRFDLCLVDQGELIGADTVSLLRRQCGAVFSYVNDDPFGGRDRRRFRLYRRALGRYDVNVVVRELNVAEAYAEGAGQVFLSHLASDELAHQRRPLSAEARLRWDAGVLFIGTWMEERGPFMAALLDAGLPLAIYGNRWQKAPQWPKLSAAWRGPALYGADYALAIQCAKVSLGLLSKGNRDDWTTRSAEIPALGGLLCAERTATHQRFYAEGRDAVFWGDVDECVFQCRRLLGDAALRERIAVQGRLRAQRNGLRNENIMAEILALAVMATADRPAVSQLGAASHERA